MLSVAEIIDKILPLNREDANCGFKKAKKLKERANLIMLINQYKLGENVVLPEQVLNLLQ